jgi:hypothetical protein
MPYKIMKNMSKIYNELASMKKSINCAELLLSLIELEDHRKIAGVDCL